MADWLLALESSTPHGGAALLENGSPRDAVLLEEGLRHGRELVSSAAEILERNGLAPAGLAAVAVSEGPGSYTGIRVGVMAAKALAYGAGKKLALVSSLAALAQTAKEAGAAQEGDTVLVLQDARRDEVYAGVYTIKDGEAAADRPDAALAPEEAAVLLRTLREKRPGTLRLAGSAFTTYREVIAPNLPSLPGRVAPSAVGILGFRKILREENADPMQAQPVYLRRDEGADWRHDHLIAQGSNS